MLNEHLWSGIIHRSETGEERKEDDVNLLDNKGLYKYLKKRYKSKDGKNLFVVKYGYTDFDLFCYPASTYMIDQTTPSDEVSVYIWYPNVDHTCVLSFQRYHAADNINRQEIIDFIRNDGFELYCHNLEHSKTDINVISRASYVITVPDNKSFIKLWDDVISVINKCNVEKR